MTKEILIDQQSFREDIDLMGFDIQNPEYLNSTNDRGLTPLMETITMFGYGWDENFAAILKKLLVLGADPKRIFTVPYEGGEEPVNAIAFAASRGEIKAFTIIYEHDPYSINTLIEPGVYAFTCLLSTLDTPAFDCEKYKAIITLLVQKKFCDVKALLLDNVLDLWDVCPEECPNAIKFLRELGVVLPD